MKKALDNFIFGRNPVKEAVKSNRCLRVYLTNSFNDKEILDLIRTHHVPQFIKTREQLDSLCDGGNHQGIYAEIKPYEYVPLDAVLKDCKIEDNPILVMLDGINDPHNMGAIIRSCDIFGVKGVIVGKHDQVALTSAVAKTSAGAINYVPVCEVNNLNQTCELLKQKGFWVVSSDGSADKNYFDVTYDFPTVLIIGSEGKGVSQLLLKNSDFVIKIPMYGSVNSLNASVAAGILLANIKK